MLISCNVAAEMATDSVAKGLESSEEVELSAMARRRKMN
jgi:hypothetical protein